MRVQQIEMSSHQHPIVRIPEDSRITTFPIARPRLWEMYKTTLRLFWTSEDYDGKDDVFQYNNVLSSQEKNLVDLVLAFFASADNLVNVNILDRFREEVGIVEATMFYNFQAAMEDIHATTYSKMIETMITDSTKRHMLYKAVEHMPSVRNIAKFIQSTTESSDSFATRLVRMICVEGAVFFGSFGIIYWFASKGLLPGLTSVNQYIARDETYHTLFAIELYNMLGAEFKLSQSELYAILDEALKVASDFISEAIPNPVIGLSIATLVQYVQHQIDVILHHMALPVRYKVENPFSFMKMLNMETKGNFFEYKVTSYSHVVEQTSADDDDY
jgi:ribonucleotide reductase beta subunit family protein with ferritin-like domain